MKNNTNYLLELSKFIIVFKFKQIVHNIHIKL